MHTPSHLEDNFYEWDAKNIGNISFYFDLMIINLILDQAIIV